MRAPALEDAPRDEVAVAPGLDRLLGRLHQDRERGLAQGRALLEQAGERIPVRADLLPREEEEAGVDRRGRTLLLEPACELDHDRESALHVGGA